MDLTGSLHPMKKRADAYGEEEAQGLREGLGAEASKALVLSAASCPSGTLRKMM